MGLESWNRLGLSGDAVGSVALVHLDVDVLAPQGYSEEVCASI